MPTYMVTIWAMPVTHTKEMLEVILRQAFNVWSKDITILVHFCWILWVEANSRSKSILCDHITLDVTRSCCWSGIGGYTWITCGSTSLLLNWRIKVLLQIWLTLGVREFLSYSLHFKVLKGRLWPWFRVIYWFKLLFLRLGIIEVHVLVLRRCRHRMILSAFIISQLIFWLHHKINIGRVRRQFLRWPTQITVCLAFFINLLFWLWCFSIFGFLTLKKHFK